MPLEQINVFIVHTPFQHLIANHLLTDSPEFGNSENYLVLDMKPEILNIERKNWKGIIELAPPVGSSVIGSGRNCRRALAQIDSLVGGYPEARLFVSDIDWPLNNAVYGYIKKKRDRKIKMGNYPDGIGSLLVRRPDPKRKFRNIIKSFMGLLGGAPYYTYDCDIMGIGISDVVYSLMPTVIENKTDKKIVQIPKFNLEKSDMNRGGCIFIGQDFENMMTEEKYRQMCRQAAEYTANLGYSDLYYKVHHFSGSRIETEAFLERGFELFTDPRPIEEVFLSRQMKCTVSYNSSALLHLKLMFGEVVRCVSILNKTSLRSILARANRIDDVWNLFESGGVEIHAE